MCRLLRQNLEVFSSSTAPPLQKQMNRVTATHSAVPFLHRDVTAATRVKSQNFCSYVTTFREKSQAAGGA